MFSHHIDKSECSPDIVLIIFPRKLHGFTDRLLSGKMNASLYITSFRKKFFKPFSIPDIKLIKNNILTCYLFNSLQRLFRRVVQIIYNNYFLSGIQKFNHCMASDKTAATCYKYCHKTSLDQFILFRVHYNNISGKKLQIPSRNQRFAAPLYRYDKTLS